MWEKNIDIVIQAFFLSTVDRRSSLIPIKY